jgi:Spy/CpxP family protein refolding chaperone
MNKRFFIVFTMVLAAAAGLATTALAAQGRGKFGHHQGWMLQRMTRELNLTEAQQAQIKSILQTQRAKIKPLTQQLHQNEQARSAVITGSFDETQARAFAGKQTQIMSDLIVEKERTKSEIYAVLTPDQRSKAQQLMQQREQRRLQRMQKHSQRETQVAPSQ